MRGNKRFRVVVAEPLGEEALSRLGQVADVQVLKDSKPETVLAAVPDADALVVRTRTHVTKRVIEAGEKLRVIARASPTMDHVDLRAAGRRNISVVYAPHIGVTSAAEYALAMILALHRRIPHYDRRVRQGQFENLRAPAGREMGRQTLGLLGANGVAEHLGLMCRRAFGQRVIYHDPLGLRFVKLEAEPVDLEALFRDADIISVHLPADRATERFVSAARIAMMKPTAILVNVCKGSTVDVAAVAQALKKGAIAGAGLDVFESEPLAMDHPIRRAPNCILTPHVAGMTLDADRERYDVVDDLVRVLNGQPPQHPAPSPR